MIAIDIDVDLGNLTAAAAAPAMAVIGINHLHRPTVRCHWLQFRDPR